MFSKCNAKMNERRWSTVMAALLLFALVLPAHAGAQSPVQPLPDDDPLLQVEAGSVITGAALDFPALDFPPLNLPFREFDLDGALVAPAEAAADYPLAASGIPLEGPLAINTAAMGAHSVYTADFDNDGDLDVVSAARDDGNILWYRNMGGLTPVLEPYLIATLPGVYLALPADVNGDGKMDVVTVSVGTVSSDHPSGQPGQGRAIWFLNDGAANPTFHARSVAEGLNYPVAAQVGDVDGDGALDVIVASRDDNSVRWYRNSGGGEPTFAPNLISNQAVGAVSVDVGDINKDGALDVISASENDDRILWYANNGSGGFSTHVVRAGNPNPAQDFAKSVEVVDVNGDGWLDIVYASEDGNEVGWYRSGGGAFPSWTQQVLDTDRIHVKQVTSGDLDRDGDVDLIAASADDNRVTWYRNSGGANPTFTTHVVTNLAAGARYAHVADLNGDGSLDVLYAARMANSVGWVRNRSIHFGATYPAQGHFAVGYWDSSRFVTSADLDGDGDIDLVSAAEDDLVWHQNKGTSPATFTSIPIGTTQDRSRWIDPADIDGDGDLDLIVASTENRTIYWYENSGGATPNFAERIVSNNLQGPRAAIAGDMDGDGDLDIFAVSDIDSKVVWYENNGARPPAFVERVIDTNAGGASAYPRHIYSADLDNDGDLDLVVAAQESNTIVTYLNNGNRPATFTRRIVAGHNPGGEPKIQGVQHVWTADVDNDGLVDILAASELSRSVYWFEAVDPAAGGYIPHAVDMNANGAHAVVAGDADGDGDMDLFAALEYDGLITWYENDGAALPTFTRRTIYDQGGIAHGVNVADLDGDGDLDVFAAARGTGVIAWFENLGGQYALQDMGAAVVPGIGGVGPRAIQTALISSRGRAGDLNAHIANVLVRFTNGTGTMLGTAEIAARITSVGLYLDSNGNGFLDSGDRLLANETRLDQAVNGTVSLVGNVGEPAQIVPGGTVRIFVVAQLSPSCGTNTALRPVIVATGNTVVDGMAAGALLGEGMRSLGGSTTVAPDAARFLRINEVVMLNVNGITDPQEPGEHPDWIEVYNTGPYAVPMTGMYLTDSINDLKRSPIGAGVTIPPYGRVLFIADGEPIQGALHTTFRLDEGGERIALVDTNARLNRVLDDVTVPALLADQAWARRVDGSNTWWKTFDPTPRRANALSGTEPIQWLPVLGKSLGC